MRDRPIAIVIGGSTGMGYETALALAIARHDVIIACRSDRRSHRDLTWQTTPTLKQGNTEQTKGCAHTPLMHNDELGRELWEASTQLVRLES